MKTGDEIHIPVGSQTALGVVLWALASHSGSFFELGWLLFNNVLFGH